MPILPYTNQTLNYKALRDEIVKRKERFAFGTANTNSVLQQKLLPREEASPPKAAEGGSKFVVRDKNLTNRS